MEKQFSMKPFKSYLSDYFDDFVINFDYTILKPMITSYGSTFNSFNFDPFLLIKKLEMKLLPISTTKGGDSRAREEIHLAIYEFNVGS